MTDPDRSAAAKKAWDTRGRAQRTEPGNTQRSRGDFGHSAGEEVDLSGIDVGHSSRMDAPSPWASPNDVSRAIAVGSTGTMQDIAAGKSPLLRIGDPSKVGTEVVAQYNGSDGTVNLFPRFFREARGRHETLAHEFGHEVAQRAFSGDTASERTGEVLRPFRMKPDDPWNYDNFSGASRRPEEFIADVYSELLTSKRKPWEDEGGRYAPVYKHVLVIARKAGLPMPPWMKVRS